MSDANHPRNRPRFWRRLGFVAAGFIVFLAAIYFLLSSNFFIQSVVLPRAGAALNAEISAKEVKFKPLSGIILRDFQLLTTGPEPLVTAKEIVVRYRLASILRGLIQVDEISLDSPVVRIIQEPDGATNLDPLLEETLEEEPGADEPPQINLRNFALRNGTIRLIQMDENGVSRISEFQDLNISLDQLANNQPGEVQLSGNFFLDERDGPIERGHFLGSLQGAYHFAMDAELLPQTVQGGSRLQILESAGTYQEFAGYSGSLEADWTPEAIRNLALRFQREDLPLGEISLSGPFNMAQLEGRLNLDIRAIDRQVLNLVGSPLGWDFADTLFNSTNTIEITRGASLVNATGSLTGRDVSIHQNGRATPLLNLTWNYNFSLDLDASTLQLGQLDILGLQENREILRAGLDQPMTLSWSGEVADFTESRFNLALNQLRFEDWQSILGANAPAGTVNLNLSLAAQEQGRLLSGELNGRIQNFIAQTGEAQIELDALTFNAQAEIEDLEILNLREFQWNWTDRDQPVARGTASGRADLTTQTGTGQITLEAFLPEMLRQIQIQDLNAAVGALRLNANLSGSPDQQTVSGAVQLANFTGNYGEYPFQNYHAESEFDLGRTNSLANLRRVSLRFAQANQPGGQLDLTGRFDLDNGAGEFNFQANNLNHHALNPVAATLLEGKQLASLLLHGQGTATYDPEGDATLRANLTLSNLIITGPDQTRTSPAPGSATFQINTAFNQTQNKETLKGDLRLIDWNGQFGDYHFQNYNATLEYSLVQADQIVTIHQVAAAFREGTRPGGGFDLTGRFNRATQDGRLTYRILDLNQHALSPLLESALGERQLLSINIAGTGAARHSPEAESAIQTDLAITNLILAELGQAPNATPLQAQLQLDGLLQNELLDLREFLITLTPTARAQNQIALSGQLNLADTNGPPGRLTLRAQSLDLTPYYDLFAGPDTPGADPSPSPAPGQEPELEPEPIILPVQPLELDIQIAQLYLRELAATNIQASAQLQASTFRLEPFTLHLNGAPVEGRVLLDLSVPGYHYDLALSAHGVPLRPLANSFGDGPRDQYQGELLSQLRVRGAGITGPSLQQNLNADLNLTLTNLNLQILGPRTRQVLDPIALALRLPELTQTPIHWVEVNSAARNGTIHLQQFAALSGAFYAEAQGNIPMAPVLTNSPLNLPVALSLRRSLAQKANLLPENTPTDLQYVALPTFVRLRGTVGDPRTDLDKVVLSGILLRSAGAIPQIRGRAGEFLENLGGLLAPPQQPRENPNDVQAPEAPPAPETRPPAFDPRDLLRFLPNRPRATDTNAPPNPN